MSINKGGTLPSLKWGTPPAPLLSLYSILGFVCVFLQEMGVEGERKRLEMAGATGAIEEGYRQGLTTHATRLNKVKMSSTVVPYRRKV